MSTRSVTILVVLGLVVLLLSQTLYIVTEKERAIQLRFGEVVVDDVPSGLHWKVPFIDTVAKFDSRVLTNNSQPERFLTVGRENLIVDAFVKWRVDRPRDFYRATAGDEFAASERLTAIANDALRAAFGVRTIFEVVSGDRDELIREVTRQVDEAGSSALGVEVVDVRIKRIDLPQEVSAAVFSRMESDREREAREIRSRGEEQAEGIRANADRQRTEIIANAYRQAQFVRGEGDAEAAQTYAQAFETDRDFYSFWRSLQAYNDAFSSDDLFVIEPDNAFFRFMHDANATTGITLSVE
ncbi:MAG: protease modulator HflC [Natronospirillum sp.]|uniref:protease modulator HflC n=1 Tax=Natronospirillum sp. TaxID=2812955 RepID=UPI0025DF52E0|nr:protease modulator HflC [Natronospirillum sp.]MCH8550710.1 protease modulator HflC [Natronospirillum sp.]